MHELLTSGDPRILIDLLGQARARTLDLIDMVEDSDLNRMLNPGFSPLRWHLGHIAAYESHWILVRAGGRPSPEPKFDRLFDPTQNPKAERVHLPPRSTLVDFAERVRASTLEVLAGATPDHPDPLLRDHFIGWLVYEHERQHQELMTVLLQMLPPDRKQRPADWTPDEPGHEPPDALVVVPEGTFRLGTTGRSFAYDNEREPHDVRLDAFQLARSPATELAFLAFIEAGGYREERQWSIDGWRWRCQEAAQAPRGWCHDEDRGWIVRTMFADREPLPGYPVVGVSWYEADAFARWSGRRLPTEAEWERAAAWDLATGQSRIFPWGDTLPSPELANSDGLAWGTRPVLSQGRSAAGCDDMAGQVWEWTASCFGPYPGFTPFPYEGYSQSWFDGKHQVLRGGSWATAGPLCRAAFRNWYEPQVREIHAGFRTAARA